MDHSYFIIVNILVGAIAGIASGWASVRVSMAINRNEIKHIWAAIRDLKKTDNDLWVAINDVRKETHIFGGGPGHGGKN